ncbi:MAG: acetyl-CoA carboxylase biotin carboxyl carrier protein [Verrucomicrobiota bacterium]|jgi:acetyl-CoA carboxylase biotin carboxyl carrier protein|nr:acetyl-CoA carboxylase biotin carboxyl carrier protein [Verrucomicrobiota bacterium]
MDIKDIKAIVDLMKKNSMTEFEMEKGDFKIRLQRDAHAGKRSPAPEPVIIQAPAVAQPPPAPAAPITAPSAAETPSAPAATSGTEVKSPMIGTFYRRPSPDTDPYAEIGKQVEPDTVVCIIEAMKVMNEIKAETRGVITEILIEDAKPVEYGQVLFRIEPN